MTADEPVISNSEERMLRALVSGDAYETTLDWVTLQHLKQKGLVEETAAGPRITDKGKKAMARLDSTGH